MAIKYKEIIHPNFMTFYQGSMKIDNKIYKVNGESKEGIKKAFQNLLKLKKINYAL